MSEEKYYSICTNARHLCLKKDKITASMFAGIVFICLVLVLYFYVKRKKDIKMILPEAPKEESLPRLHSIYRNAYPISQITKLYNDNDQDYDKANSILKANEKLAKSLRVYKSE